MEEQPLVVWCGGCNNGQDISIRLVLHGLSAKGSQADDHPMGEEALAVLKVHSSQLRRNSKYFETCLSERWREQGAGASDARLEFSLEANADVACYTDCFSRMYSPSRRDFRDVEYGLELLRVASQIEYHELMDCISQYLSAIRWSDEDERKIREYASSPDFSRNHAEDLVSRLGLDVVGEDHVKMTVNQIQKLAVWGMKNAFASVIPHENFHRKLIEELIVGIQACEVTKIIIELAKKHLVEIENRCQILEPYPEALFYSDIEGISWILKLFMSAGVAEELVQCLVALKAIPKKFLDAGRITGSKGRKLAVEMATVVLQMFKEVVDGKLLLKTTQRITLFDWDWEEFLDQYLPEEDVIATKRKWFLTLTFKDQCVFLREKTVDYFDNFVDPRHFATIIKKRSLDMEEGRLKFDEGKSIDPGFKLMLLLYILSCPCDHTPLLVAADVIGSNVEISCLLVHS